MFARIAQAASLAWQLLYACLQILYGMWKISRIGGPYVSIFGSARFVQKDPYAQKAHDLAQMFVRANISVLTGGGPGIMEAASCGAVLSDTKAQSIGIGVKDLNEGRNACVQLYFELRYFFARKWLLTHYSSAFIIFPGGFGTLDEMAEVLTLIQTNHLKRVPIVLIGTEFWQPFFHWVESEALKHGTISKQDAELFTITDDLHQAFCISRDECGAQNQKK